MLTNWNIKFWEYEFLSPHWLWLLLLVPAIVYLIYRNERNRSGDYKYTGLNIQQRSLGSKWISRVRELVIITYGLILIFLIFSLAKPFHWSLYDDSSNNFEDGIDIIIAMDVSGSMMAIDFVPNRLEASKKVAMEFVDGRKGDRIGLVVYGERAYTACPATLDYEVLKKQIKKISMDPRIGGNTAIGTGLGTSVTRLREDKKSGKVIILLTDGRNNAGDITPLEAAELAKEKNIRVYTIGLGSKEDAMSPQNSVFGTHFQSRGSDIDEETLKKIAKMTNGQYFRATDKESLKEIYKEIEKLETREMEGMRFKSEPPAHPQAFLNWAFVLAMISFGVKMILFRNSD